MYKTIAALLLMLSACGNTAQNKTSTMSQATMSADEPSQQKIRVKAGAVFTIDLKCNAGTGYSWQLTDSSTASYQFLKQDFRNLNPDKDGGDGMQTFHFKAVQKGADSIKLIYVQPFNKPFPPDAPAKTFSLDIY